MSWLYFPLIIVQTRCWLIFFTFPREAGKEDDILNSSSQTLACIRITWKSCSYCCAPTSISNSVHLGLGPRTCLLKMSPCDVNAAGLGTALAEPVSYSVSKTLIYRNHLGWDRMGGREAQKGGDMGIGVCIWLIHFAVQQKLTQHCEAIILQ